MGHKVMELLLIQSQEHDKLPIAELKAVLETENIDTSINKLCSGLVILEDLKNDDFDKNYLRLTERLGYTHEVNQIIKKSSLENLEHARTLASPISEKSSGLSEANSALYSSGGMYPGCVMTVFL